MCTVTYIPSKGKAFLTSNRDEKVSRGKALTPQMQVLPNGDCLLFPKDPDAGGSWIALKNTGDAAVLLNGAFVAHQRQNYYGRSRGLILLDVVGNEQPGEAFNRINLYDVEPFTLILFVNGRLYECRWDGAEKFTIELNVARAYIWSSATLYNPETRAARERWFDEFLHRHPLPSQAEILNFHHTGGDGDAATNIRMNREDMTKTVSITSLQLSEAGSSLLYEDLERQATVSKSFHHIEKGVAYA